MKTSNYRKIVQRPRWGSLQAPLPHSWSGGDELPPKNPSSTFGLSDLRGQNSFHPARSSFLQLAHWINGTHEKVDFPRLF